MRFRQPIPQPTVGPTLHGALRERAVTQQVSGYTSMGCYSDSDDRVLDGPFTKVSRNDPQYCCDWCANANTEYTICGVENGNECFCDSTTHNAMSVADSHCTSTCADVGDQDCGGFWYVNLYSATAPIITTATYKTLATQQVSDFSHFGCYSDYSDRVLRGIRANPPLNNARYCCEWCLNIDSNNQWCGVENGGECFCDSTTHNAISASDSDCSLPCPGAPSYECGASWRVNLYKVTGVSPTIATTTALSESSASSQPDDNGGLAGGAIAGVVVGVVAAVALLGLLVFFLMRRRRPQVPSEPEPSTPATVSKSPLEMATPDHAHELQSLTTPPCVELEDMPEHQRQIYEMDSNR